MFKFTDTYLGVDGEERTEDFYFRLTEAEVLKLEVTTGNGGYTEMLNRIINAKEGPEIYNTFEKLVHAAYGRKSADGKGFEKSAEILNAFVSTEAYSHLIIKLATEDDFAAKFVNQIMPNNKKEQNNGSIPFPNKQ